MTVKKLIALLQKCNPQAQVFFWEGKLNSKVDFVEHQLTSNSVLLLDNEPNWKKDGEADGVEIVVSKHELRFAETTWKDI